MNKYSIIQTPLNKWAVIYPFEPKPIRVGSRVIFPKWLPANHSHMGIFKTLDEAVIRMNNLNSVEAN